MKFRWEATEYESRNTGYRLIVAKAKAMTNYWVWKAEDTLSGWSKVGNATSQLKAKAASQAELEKWLKENGRMKDEC